VQWPLVCQSLGGLLRIGSTDTGLLPQLTALLLGVLHLLVQWLL